MIVLPTKIIHERRSMPIKDIIMRLFLWKKIMLNNKVDIKITNSGVVKITNNGENTTTR